MGQQPSVTLPNSVDDVSYDADSNTLTYTYYDGTKKKVTLNNATPGVGISSASTDSSGNLILNLSNQTTLKPVPLPTGLPGIQGLPGPSGAPGSVGPFGPKGDKGDKGDQGAQGPQGLTGPAGKDGQNGKDGDPQNRNFGDGAPIINGWGGFKTGYNTNNSNPWVINDNVSNRLTRDGIDIVTGRSVVNNMFVGPSQIYFPNKGKCLSVASDKVSPLLDNCANTPNQLWYKNINTGHIYNAGQQKCLQSTFNGRWKLVGCDTQQANQYFQFPDGSIKTPNTGKCLDSSQDYWNNDCNKSDTQYVLFTPFNIADRSKVMFSPINTGMNEPNIQ